MRTEEVMKRFFWIFLVIPALFSCDEDKYSKSDEVNVRPLNAEEKFLVNASNNFALKVLNDLQADEKGNIVFSPLGLGMASGILSNSVEEVNYKLLGVEELQPIEVNKAFYEVEAMLPNIDHRVNLNFANALWNKSSLSLSEDFTTRIMAYYNADVRSMDFEKESSEKYINKWIELRSNHQFNSIKEFNRQKDLYLVNASTFSFPYYNEIEVENVTKEIEAPIVFAYENESFELHEYLLGKNSFSLITITPKQGQELTHILNDLSVKNIDHFRDNVKRTEANQFPDINFEFEHNYANVFNQNWLSHFLIDQSVKNLDAKNFQFDITHKAAVNISFDSVEPSNLPTTNTDSYQPKPFLFFITESHTELLLFAGISQKVEH